MTTVKITRQVKLPDPVKLARYEKSPELGPKILFFSGGTALRDLSAGLIRYTHNSIHMVTPFDSGGSSAKLRTAFKMPAVGDIRNRLMALADQSLHGNPEIYALFSYRLSKKKSQKALLAELESMLHGHHRLVAKIPDPLRKIVRYHLLAFLENMPDDFDLRGASMGNVVLTAGYLSNRRHLDPVIFIFSKLVQVRGIVRPIVNKDVHLVGELEDGELVIGQHLLTGKEVAPITKKVRRVFLSDHAGEPSEIQVSIRNKTKKLIDQADLICYPMGSFYTSLVANVLPKGVGEAVKKNPCPKVFIPNTDKDPEMFGLNLVEQVERLIGYLKKDAPHRIATGDVLDFVLLDTKGGRYPGSVSKHKLRALGMEVIDCPLVTKKSKSYIDAERLIPILLSLA
jgi:CofD-related protein of GAK system